jgi:hypothetical protein
MSLSGVVAEPAADGGGRLCSKESKSLSAAAAGLAEGALMDDGKRLGIDLNFWDDAVGAFEPLKVLRRLQQEFPGSEIDPTDHQRVRLLRELEFWSQGERELTLREKLVRQSWDLYQTNGPTYRFVVPFPSGHRASGGARRLSVWFQVPAELPPEQRAHLQAFLLSLRMGEPMLDDGQEGEPGTAAGGRP